MHVTQQPLTEPIAVGAQRRSALWRLGLGLCGVAALSGVGRGEADPAGQVAHWSVPLDQAQVADLELLPGVGPTLARRMSQVCAEPTPIRAVDLMRVPRLGPTGRSRMMPWVVLEAVETVEAVGTAGTVETAEAAGTLWVRVAASR